MGLLPSHSARQQPLPLHLVPPETPWARFTAPSLVPERCVARLPRWRPRTRRSCPRAPTPSKQAQCEQMLSDRVQPALVSNLVDTRHLMQCSRLATPAVVGVIIALVPC